MKIDTLIKAIKTLENRAIARPLNPKEERQFFAFFCEAWDSLLYKPNPSLFGTQQVLGKHKLPRFMYHITTESAYESMLKDGFIKPSQCTDSSSGTFLFDLKNFTRFWRQTKDVAEQPRTTLLSFIADKFCSNPNDKIVMLKIPTAKLDARTMRLRRQKLCRAGARNVSKVQQETLNDKHKASHTLGYLKYSMQGENVAKAPLYNQSKEAVEYIVPEAIPMTDVTLIGKTTVDTQMIKKAEEEMQDLPQVWLDLTKGTPEQKSFEYMV